VKYRNREFGFEIEYNKDNWETEEITGQNSGIQLLNRHYLNDAPFLFIRGWYPPQIHENEEVIKKLGTIKIGKLTAKKRIIRHQAFTRPLEIFLNFKDFGVQFLFTGRARKDEEKEFEDIAKSFRLIHEKG